MGREREGWNKVGGKRVGWNKVGGKRDRGGIKWVGRERGVE